VLVNRWDQTVTIPNQVVEAVKHYVAELQSFELSTVKDSWMFAHWEHQLQLAKIPYIELAPNSIGDELYEYADRYPNTLCVFHTDTATQKIVADSIIQQIQKIEIYLFVNGAMSTVWLLTHAVLDVVLCIAAIAKQKQTWTDPKFIPHPATWLNGKRWLDGVEITAGKQLKYWEKGYQP
jgi:hypothetical protein